MKQRPRPRLWKFCLVVAALVALAFAGLRLAAEFWPALAPWAWPVLSAADLALAWAGRAVPWADPTAAAGLALAGLWVGEIVGELLVVALLLRFGRLVYDRLHRWLLEPLFLRPTEWLIERTTAGYARLLRLALRAWPVVIMISLALIVYSAGILYFGVLGTELAPSEDQSRFVIRVVCDVGSSLNHVDAMLQECEQRLADRPDVISLLTTVATDRGQPMNEADIFVQLTPRNQRRYSQHQIMEKVRADLEQIIGIRVVLRDLSTEGFTAQRGDPIDFAIQGSWERLPAAAERVKEAMAASGLLQDIDSDYRPGMSEVQVYPDRNKMAQLGVPVSRLADSLSLLVGGQRVAKFTDRGRRYDVRVRLQLQQRGSPDQLAAISLRAGANRLVPLSDVASTRTLATLPAINRYNHERKIEITANPTPGVSQGQAIAACRQIIARELPGDEFRVVELGNAQALEETIQSLVFALVLGIVIAYMVLGVQFNSFVHPLTVLLALPFAVTGALTTLWLTGDSLNMMSLIGLVLLMGLVKKNSIILVDYTNQLLSEAPTKTLDAVQSAVLKACPIRLRPIVMTSVATVAGALPAAVGLGPGAETRAPMARGIIGGIVLSTLVTLILVPVFYVLVERLRLWLSTLVTTHASPAAAPAATPAAAS
jgi:multidrug efflux pump subunit AcrB